MTNKLIEAADALLEQMKLIEKEAERTIEHDEEDPIRMLDWFDTEWHNTIQAYRSARESAGEVGLVDQVLDAANDYMKEQYGIGALGHPVDRSRIRSALA